MTLTLKEKLDPIVGVIKVLSEFVNKTIPQITIAVGNINQRTNDPFRPDFNTFKETIAAKIDTKG